MSSSRVTTADLEATAITEKDVLFPLGLVLSGAKVLLQGAQKG